MLDRRVEFARIERKFDTLSNVASLIYIGPTRQTLNSNIWYMNEEQNNTKYDVKI